jgi:hypothetical protein
MVTKSTIVAKIGRKWSARLNSISVRRAPASSTPLNAERTGQIDFYLKDEKKRFKVYAGM